jgi:hypothetical protein
VFPIYFPVMDPTVQQFYLCVGRRVVAYQNTLTVTSIRLVVDVAEVIFHYIRWSVCDRPSKHSCHTCDSRLQ